MHKSAFKKTSLVMSAFLAIFLFAMPSISAATFAQSSASPTVIRSPVIAGYSTCDIDLASAAINCSHGSSSAVYATFNVPRVTCNPAKGTQGQGIFIDLLNNVTAGPFATAGEVTVCLGGTALYAAVVGGPLTSLPFSYLYVVQPGDTISAGLWIVRGTLYYSIADKTLGSISEGQLSFGSDNHLGQVAALIGMSPGPSSTQYLEKFATVHLTAQVTINGKTIPIGASKPIRLVLTDLTGKIVEAVPSPITNHGKAFSLIWKAD
jgi:hypothetical protein